MSDQEYIDVYRRYLVKFEQSFGDLAFDDTVQRGGKLIKKLRYDEFVSKWTEYKQIEVFLRDVMTKGATLNDDLYKLYTELSAHLLESPKDFMTL